MTARYAQSTDSINGFFVDKDVPSSADFTDDQQLSFSNDTLFLESGGFVFLGYQNGLDGATGATGPTGANGLNGVTGATGPTGANGLNGVTGALEQLVLLELIGLNGATTNRATGPTGANGLNGTTGLGSYRSWSYWS